MKISFIILLILVSGIVYAQDKTIYNPEADAQFELNQAISLANKSGKHVFIQIGGNWCPWCIKFHNYVESTPEVKSILDENYILIRVNYSKENKNLETLKRLEYPQRFGFPVFVILDQNGKRLHTQDSAMLEEDGGYGTETVKRFLLSWTPAALAKYDE